MWNVLTRKLNDSRVIARLDIKGEKLIKGIQLDGLKEIGNPNKFALKYFKDGIDEIFLVDIVASLYGRNNLINVIRNSAKNIFIPIIVGGGIRNEENAYEILKNGADKISLNTAAVNDPKLITKISKDLDHNVLLSLLRLIKLMKTDGKYLHITEQKNLI